MEKVFNKLVRDKIPNIIEEKGEKAYTRILNDDEYFKELLIKLEEETKEVIGTNNNEDLLEELGDVYEVIKSIAEAKGFSTEDIVEVADEKRSKRGGFKDKIFLIKTDDN